MNIKQRIELLLAKQSLASALKNNEKITPFISLKCVEEALFLVTSAIDEADNFYRARATVGGSIDVQVSRSSEDRSGGQECEGTCTRGPCTGGKDSD